MCIQDNPRYVNLVKMGMPESTTVYYKLDRTTPYAHFHFAWISTSDPLGKIKSIGFHGGGLSPEEAFNEMFTLAEKYYALHQ